MAVTTADAFADARAAHEASGRAVRATIVRLARILLAAVLLAGVLRILFVQPVLVASGSMRPLLLEGDFLFVRKADYGWSVASLPSAAAAGVPLSGRLAGTLPERGEVVLFRAAGPGRASYLKRVVGLPGDRIALEGGRVRLNGRLLPCVPVAAGRCREGLSPGRSHEILESGSSPLSTMAEQRVPAGHVFVLGDNRDESADSRLRPEEGGAGMVATDRLIGRASRIFFSAGPDGLRTDRIGMAIR
jgi:signal peptidase I